MTTVRGMSLLSIAALLGACGDLMPARRPRSPAPPRLGPLNRPRKVHVQDPRQATINQLTNYERNQWARAGYKGDPLRFKGCRQRRKEAT